MVNKILTLNETFGMQIAYNKTNQLSNGTEFKATLYKLNLKIGVI